MKLPFSSFIRRAYERKTWWLATLLLSLGALEICWQYQENRFVAAVAHQILSEAGAVHREAQIVALRDYLRRTVRWQGAPIEGRPFLRNTTSETLQSGEGYCGEVTRAFINLAGSVGINAQRINLYGSALHVVAEAELTPGKNIIVDCQNPPSVAELEPLDRVILRPEYDDYSTLNVRRLGLSSLFSRIKLQMGAFTYWTENPHALKAIFWFGLAGLFIAIKGLRDVLRFSLKKRGWVHRSDHDAVEAAIQSWQVHRD